MYLSFRNLPCSAWNAQTFLEKTKVRHFKSLPEMRFFLIIVSEVLPAADTEQERDYFELKENI